MYSVPPSNQEVQPCPCSDSLNLQGSVIDSWASHESNLKCRALGALKEDCTSSCCLRRGLCSVHSRLCLMDVPSRCKQDETSQGSHELPYQMTVKCDQHWSNPSGKSMSFQCAQPVLLYILQLMIQSSLKPLRFCIYRTLFWFKFLKLKKPSQNKHPACKQSGLAGYLLLLQPHITCYLCIELFLTKQPFAKVFPWQTHAVFIQNPVQ